MNITFQKQRKDFRFHSFILEIFIIFGPNKISVR